MEDPELALRNWIIDALNSLSGVPVSTVLSLCWRALFAFTSRIDSCVHCANSVNSFGGQPPPGPELRTLCVHVRESVQFHLALCCHLSAA